MVDDVYQVERRLHYATNVDDMQAAWAFVMAHVDEFKEPQISIGPVWMYDGPTLFTDAQGESRLMFQVTVAGNTKEEA